MRLFCKQDHTYDPEKDRGVAFRYWQVYYEQQTKDYEDRYRLQAKLIGELKRQIQGYLYGAS